MRIDLKDVKESNHPDAVGMSPYKLAKQICSLKDSSEEIAQQNKKIVQLLEELVVHTREMSSKGDAMLEASVTLNVAASGICEVANQSNNIMQSLSVILEEMNDSPH